MSGLRSQFTLPTVLSGYATLDAMLRDARLTLASDYFAGHPQFAERLIAPTERFGSFLRETTEQLAETDDAAMQLALEGSIVLADDVVSTNLALSDDLAIEEEAEDTDHEVPAAEGALVLPFIQRSELVGARDHDA